jgi:hypothetical protein
MADSCHASQPVSNRIDLPGGGVALHLGPKEEVPEMQRIINARYDFSITFCRSKGWSEELEELSIEQILEIRQQEGWKNP